MSLLKYKLLSVDELIINLDRLSRFKLPEDVFPRVFYNIIFKHLISPKYSKQEIEALDAYTISKIVKTIWNESVKHHFNIVKRDKNKINLIKFLVNASFKNTEARTKVLINTDLIISPILDIINYDSAPYNLKFLIKADKTAFNYDILRKKFSLKFPIRKLLIVEGITEEILLPVFAEQLNCNFNQEGIYILGAGGKSKSPSLYMQYKNKLKIPAILLFDSDAKEIFNDLKNNLLNKDSEIIIEKGEFEDILSLNLIKRALNKEYIPATPILKSDLKLYPKMCDNIEHFYKIRKLGEFKKSNFAKIIAKNVKYNTDITLEIKKIVYNIIKD